MVCSIIKKSELEGALRIDAEYYQPEYLGLNSALITKNAEPLINLTKNIICGPFGSAILNVDYQDEGIPLIRVSDLNNWFVLEDDLVFIDAKLSQKLKRYQVENEDIVVSQRGTIAMFSKVTNKFAKWNISANLISIKKSEKVDFNYLLVFLNSKYGINQLFRRLSGQVQPKITTDDIKQLLIFLPSKNVQTQISELVLSSREQQIKSDLLYARAEEVLLEELGLADFDREGELCNVVMLSLVKLAWRMDAEYFQPKYEKLVSVIKKKNGRLLGELVSVKKGIETGAEEYQEDGKLFIRVSSLSKNGLIDKDQKYLSNELYQKLKKDFEPKVGEILLTKDATPGIAYTLKEPTEGIISGGILRLKLKEKEIEPEYLTLCINSIIGKMQAERDAGGSIIAHWKPEQIKNIVIPILANGKQEEIANLVKKSHEARKKAKELLKEAKNKVEELIEK